jgi:hypothetical protein
MNDVTKKIVVVYCITIILAILIVPWKIDWHSKRMSTTISQGYSFVLSPPVPAATIDFSKIFLEIVLITAGAGIIYVMRDKIFGKYWEKASDVFPEFKPPSDIPSPIPQQQKDSKTEPSKPVFKKVPVILAII